MVTEGFSRGELEELLSLLHWPWCDVEAPMDGAKRGRIFKAGRPPVGRRTEKHMGLLFRSFNFTAIPKYLDKYLYNMYKMNLRS